MNRSSHAQSEAFLILVVDDDEALRHLIKKKLALRGFSVTAVAEAQEALSICRNAPPDLIVSDWCLGPNSLSGIDILKALRSQDSTKNIPLIMMSSIKDNPDDEALVRSLGGDLFLTKSEIMDSGLSGQAFARHVRALVSSRRQPYSEGFGIHSQQSGHVQDCGLALDQRNNSVCFNGKSCKLSASLFDLLRLLVLRYPNPLERRDLIDRILPDGRDREVDVRVSRLRAKLEEAFGCDLIETVLGVGYRIRLPAPAKDT